MTTPTKIVVALIAATLVPLMAVGETLTIPPSKPAVSTVGIMPSRGMTMDQVKASFGEPAKVIPAVGKPPISRWVYEGFIVYFEYQYVIDSVATEDGKK